MHVNGSLSLIDVIVFRRIAVGMLGFLVLLRIYLLTAIRFGLVGSLVGDTRQSHSQTVNAWGKVYFLKILLYGIWYY